MSLEGSAYPPRPCARFSRVLDSQVSHANQVVRGRGESEHPSHQILSAYLRLALPADRLHPSEDFFHPLPLLLTRLITAVSRRPRVDGARPSCILVLRHVRCDRALSQQIHKLLGTDYLFGSPGVPQDYNEAQKWLRLAVEHGDKSALLQLGAMYHFGWGIPQNDAAALKYYRSAAQQADPIALPYGQSPQPKAQAYLGHAYGYGWGVTKDLSEALKWY